MDTCLVRLSDVCYEIEGIIALLKERGQDAPQDIYRLLRNKTHELCEMVDNIGVQHVSTAVVRHGEPAPVAESVKDSGVTETIPENYTLNQQVDNCIYIGNVLTENINVAADNTTISNDVEESQEFAAEQIMSLQNPNDIRKEFSINDRFRFRRELFGNSDTEMSDTLNLISAMTNLCEVEEYFYHDMEWDMDNEEVHDFMSIIANYFKYKKNNQ